MIGRKRDGTGRDEELKMVRRKGGRGGGEEGEEGEERRSSRQEI